MNKLAIIGAGISGLSVANLLRDNYKVTVFEKESTPGGLIRCERVNGCLFHICGGHIFNSKRDDVLRWFWNYFKHEEFYRAKRNSVIFFEPDQWIPYPIENNIYRLSRAVQHQIYKEWDSIEMMGTQEPNNFEDFFKIRFGKTLYSLYFEPYNRKIWNCDLADIPLSWLQGKLPMPSIDEMKEINNKHTIDDKFVHSSFWYGKNNGSQYIADRLSEFIDIKYNSNIEYISYDKGQWSINEDYYDMVVFCGNIKDLSTTIKGVDVPDVFFKEIEQLKYHGTTTVFCKIEPNPYSWIYQPSTRHKSHRIICTGNFSETNNIKGINTASIEFTGEVHQDTIVNDLGNMPYLPQYITHKYNQFTYPIQDSNTRGMIQELKKYLSNYHFYFTGRFADWEYYNMDVAIGAAMDMCKKIKQI